MLNAQEKQDWLRAYSPTNLRYAAAIRGYVPADHSEGYVYAQLNCGDGSTLIGLAASNPEGIFFGFDGDSVKLEAASKAAADAGIDNVKFVPADSAALLDALQSGVLKPSFHYVVAHMTDKPVSEIAPTVSLAGKMLDAGGLCYVAYPTTASHADQSTFIASYKSGSTNTDVAHAAASAGQLAFVGSARVRANYMELSVPTEHQQKLIELHGQPIFESLKDFSIGGYRHDLWVKPGAQQSDNVSTLLQNFTFGASRPAAYIDPQFKYFDKKLDLTTPLFTRLLAVLSEGSHTIGDLLAHSEFKNVDQADLVNGLQMLVAIGMIEPARGKFAFSVTDFSQPHFLGGYNQRLASQPLSEEGALIASPLLGRPLLGTAPMVMTLQALNAGGVKNAEEWLDNALAHAPAGIKTMIGTDLTDGEARRNTAYSLLEQTLKDWMLFCYVNGIMS